MSAAREEILGRIAAATAAAQAPPQPEPRTLVRPGRVEELAKRLNEYRASVTWVAPGEVTAAVDAILERQGVARVVAPPDLSPEWRPARVELLEDEPPLAAERLATIDAALTGSRLAIARTGTIVLDGGPGQGRRALSLLPDLHICVVRAETIVLDVEDAIAALDGSAAPITFISGPSATSDIELERVEGVHGPRHLEVVLREPTGGRDDARPDDPVD